jgi:hypothetical protein
LPRQAFFGQQAEAILYSASRRWLHNRAAAVAEDGLRLEAARQASAEAEKTWKSYNQIAREVAAVLEAPTVDAKETTGFWAEMAHDAEYGDYLSLTTRGYPATS